MASSFFLVAADAVCQSFCRFFDAATANIFSSVNKMMLTSLGKYFSADVLNVSTTQPFKTSAEKYLPSDVSIILGRLSLLLSVGW